jgi:hypothetical protein
MFGITNIVAKNPEGIKLMVKKVFNFFGNRSEEEVNQEEVNQPEDY